MPPETRPQRARLQRVRPRHAVIRVHENRHEVSESTNCRLSRGGVANWGAARAFVQYAMVAT